MQQCGGRRTRSIALPCIPRRGHEKILNGLRLMPLSTPFRGHFSPCATNADNTGKDWVNIPVLPDSQSLTGDLKHFGHCRVRRWEESTDGRLDFYDLFGL